MAQFNPHVINGWKSTGEHITVRVTWSTSIVKLLTVDTTASSHKSDWREGVTAVGTVTIVADLGTVDSSVTSATHVLIATDVETLCIWIGTTSCVRTAPPCRTSSCKETGLITKSVMSTNVARHWDELGKTLFYFNKCIFFFFFATFIKLK